MNLYQVGTYTHIYICRTHSRMIHANRRRALIPTTRKWYRSPLSVKNKGNKLRIPPFVPWKNISKKQAHEKYTLSRRLKGIFTCLLSSRGVLVVGRLFTCQGCIPWLQYAYRRSIHAPSCSCSTPSLPKYFVYTCHTRRQRISPFDFAGLEHKSSLSYRSRLVETRRRMSFF